MQATYLGLGICLAKSADRGPVGHLFHSRQANDVRASECLPSQSTTSHSSADLKEARVCLGGFGFYL